MIPKVIQFTKIRPVSKNLMQKETVNLERFGYELYFLLFGPILTFPH